jgi:nitrogen fixation protein NifB
MNLEQHPCFNRDSHHRYGRIHLPVAPRCNIQCKFCNRRFDCINESRPGVTSALLSPSQAMLYLDAALAEMPHIKVVGIAGPGDPFANAEQTIETMQWVRAKYADIMLCVASNGLNIMPYIDELRRLDVTHVTITVNAVDPQLGARIYSWMRIGKRVVAPEVGAPILLENQVAAIKALKANHIVVKVNAIVLPGINDHHIEQIARRMGALGVDLFNCMPYYPSPGSALEHLPEPAPASVAVIRAAAGVHVRQMGHCTRCRADAVGLLGQAPSPTLMNALKNCEHADVASDTVARTSARPYVAVATREGVLVNQHLGAADRLLIYGLTEARIALIESRPTPAAGSGVARWHQLADLLDDCHTLLVSGVGNAPRKILGAGGMAVVVCEGLIEEALRRLSAGKSLDDLAVRKPRACGTACAGDMMGCG